MTTSTPVRPKALVKTGSKGRRRRLAAAPYMFVGLAALYLVLFALVPLVTGVQLSFTDTRLLNPTGGNFVGLDNYEQAILSGTFLRSVWTTLLYTLFSVTGCVVLGTLSAVVINRYIPARPVFRTIMVLPWAVPTVALALVFRWIYNSSHGVANRTTSALGIGEIGWVTDPDYGMAAVVIPTVWKLSPFVMLVVLAALQSVPEELYEATKVDGADSWTTFRMIVMPFLLPTLRVVVLLMTIWSFRRFEIVWLITGGGPVDATTTIVINVYRQAFNNSNLGLAAAIGVLGLLMSLIVTLVYFLVERNAQHKNEVAS